MPSTPRDCGVLQIEPTDHCNLRCAMCAPQREPRPHGVPRGFMPLPLFRRIVDGLVADDCRFDHLILQWMGEPSLHPGLPEMVGYAARRLADRLGYLRIDTNAVALDPPRAEALLRAWLPHRRLPLLLVFSLDAVSRETYRRVKGRDLRDRAYRNVRAVVDLRARLARAFGPFPLNLQFQFVVQEGNAHEARAFLDYWEAFLRCRGGGGWDEVLFKRLHVGGGAAGQAAADRLYARTIEEQGIRRRDEPPLRVQLWEERPWERDDGAPEAPRQACPALWLTPVVRHDGQLTVCCADLRGRLALGSLAERGFRELWEGPRAERLRLDHVAGRFELHEPCAHCGGINWYRTPLEAVRRTLERNGRMELWEPYLRRLGLEEPS